MRRKTCRCASTPPTPAPPAPPCARRPCPARIRKRCRIPQEIAKRIVPLASPTLKETGLIFQAKHNRFVAYRQPE